MSSKKSAKEVVIHLQFRGIEAQSTIGQWERYKHPLRRMFNTIIDTHPDIDDNSKLYIAIKPQRENWNGRTVAFTISICSPTYNKNELERFNALKLARAQMESIVVENRIKIALRSKLPPATKQLFRPQQEVRVYREYKNKWDGRLEVQKVADKDISVTDGIKLKPFNISAVLPTPPKSNDAKRNDEITKMIRLVSERQDMELPSEVLQNSDPRYNSKANKDAGKP